MTTFEDIRKANEAIKATDIGRGKEYVEVNQRVIAFRRVHPNGSIDSNIISLENGVVVIKAVCADEDGRILGTGLAYEKENSTFINRTSYIENCETSAVGRALGMAGFGIDAAICSAEEVQNAILNQEANEPIDSKKADQMKTLLQYTDSDTLAFIKMINEKFGRGVNSVDELNKREYAFGLDMLNKKVDKKEKKK